MRRFVKDDPGYLAWLAAHPDGFVLNTWAHVSSRYLVLHRAACRTINRPLAALSRWTEPYAKACSDDREELEGWALREAGAAVQPCGRCLRGEERASSPKTRPGPAGGGRVPRQLDQAIDMTGEPIRIVIPRVGSPQSPPLVIEGAQWFAETFFRRDPSAVGANSYDAWIAATQTDPRQRHRISDGDIIAVNSTMAARTSHETWAPITGAAEAAWLDRLDPSWDLFETLEADVDWPTMRAALAEAFGTVRRRGIGLAVATKVLHIKRPRLVPVLDSVVVEQVGVRLSDDIESWIDAVAAVRSVGRANLDALREIRRHLETCGVSGRSLVRILDALLWVSSPGAGLFSQLEGWERVVRPGHDR